MEQLTFLPGEGKDREKGQEDNRHREKNRPSDQVRRIAYRGHHRLPVTRVHPALFEEAESILGHHNGSVHQDTNSDGNPGQRHDIGADPGIAHAKKRRQNRQGERYRDNQHRAQMQQKDDVHQGDNDGLLQERMLEGIHRAGDKLGAVIEW